MPAAAGASSTAAHQPQVLRYLQPGVASHLEISSVQLPVAMPEFITSNPDESTAHLYSQPGGKVYLVQPVGVGQSRSSRCRSAPGPYWQASKTALHGPYRTNMFILFI
jgi:hypothetical protein